MMKNTEHYMDILYRTTKRVFDGDNITRVWKHNEKKNACTISISIRHCMGVREIPRLIREFNSNQTDVRIRHNRLNKFGSKINTLVFVVEDLLEGWSITQNSELTEYIEVHPETHPIKGIRLGDYIGTYKLIAFNNQKTNGQCFIVKDTGYSEDVIDFMYHGLAVLITEKQKKLLKLRSL
jgi:hypothetical protein